MRATLLAHTKEVRDDGAIVEIVIWRVSDPLAPSKHEFKYRLYYGCSGRDRVRYDNERGKGDHRHLNGREMPYAFESVDKLINDFERDIEDWRAP
jgi:hypothetical protein